MGKNQEERKTPVIVVKKRRTFSPPSLSEKTDIIAPVFTEQTAESAPAGINSSAVETGVSLDIENYCTLRLFFDLSTLAGLSRRNLPEAGIRLLFQI